MQCLCFKNDEWISRLSIFSPCFEIGNWVCHILFFYTKHSVNVAITFFVVKSSFWTQLKKGNQCFYFPSNFLKPFFSIQTRLHSFLTTLIFILTVFSLLVYFGCPVWLMIYCQNYHFCVFCNDICNLPCMYQPLLR